eukprot:gnl/MRDRNA2_/MRDRNA2_59404_c0_seq2.p1 gnl/MRDRNA2_/MRDRNA2_59404_c0~~gnl/MRDRNA2_/MRDRNA2_59404_c0_seq2.p1  ORF type:complete len:206 (+),score=28.03 gnl/MRDRNA2_/MRDRNA2_59404_c0_seq2:121-738(+)
MEVLKIGAVRELFEETGILLSTPSTNMTPDQARTLRTRVHKNGDEFMKVCHELNVMPDLNSLKFIHHWVTPPMVPTRFNTYFFLAVVQSARGAEADGGETVRVAWLPPSHFIKLFDDQEISFLPPQLYQLSTLAGTPSLDQIMVLSNAVEEDKVHPWQPHFLSEQQGGPAVCYPGDAAYDLLLKLGCLLSILRCIHEASGFLHWS